VAVVHVPRALLAHTGGLEQVTVDAPRVKELLAALAERFPGLAGELDELAVAIDGEVRPDAAYERLLPLTEIHLVPRMAGS
jgi:hypothetical protein